MSTVDTQSPIAGDEVDEERDEVAAEAAREKGWRGLQHAPMGHVAQPTAPLSSHPLPFHTRTPTFPNVPKVPVPLVEHSIAFW